MQVPPHILGDMEALEHSHHAAENCAGKDFFDGLSRCAALQVRAWARARLGGRGQGGRAEHRGGGGDGGGMASPLCPAAAWLWCSICGPDRCSVARGGLGVALFQRQAAHKLVAVHSWPCCPHVLPPLPAGAAAGGRQRCCDQVCAYAGGRRRGAALYIPQPAGGGGHGEDGGVALPAGLRCGDASCMCKLLALALSSLCNGPSLPLYRSQATPSREVCFRPRASPRGRPSVAT